ncbi:Pkinase-domain-containing protein [Karstenula rhodostoma CBS 690.94]|uniref:Pkinase-domain-containing protein n=1 Tax=Karstenula rhodostoma CBS 690.94 TaxID=1392251 RepID=A0A9P4PLQ4_9PLEO|nr:Pkinase-domain-containing protein [Karstenula rhodostoma CBS 690.94]
MSDHSERHWPDPTISNKHLRVHCIIYDESGTGDVPPLVYATDVSSNGTFLTKTNPAYANSQASHGVLMTRKHGAFLLDDKDELRISETVTLIYHDMEPRSDSPLTPTQEREVPRFASRYLITGRLLGQGGFGKVVVAIHQKSQRQMACKVINMKKFYPKEVMLELRLPTSEDTQPSIARESGKRWPSKVIRCSREFRILKDLSHPNIISVEKVFWSPSTIYLFQELITGGDLFSYMERKGGALNSIDAAVIVLQILKAVDYLHDRDIVHRDLKPDNILLTYPEDGARIVITDFGNARVLPKATGNDRRRMFTKTGTIEYLAPEIYEMNKTCPKGSGYSKAVDMWSIGVITANLLSNEALFGAPRFEPDPHNYTLKLAARCDLSVIDDKDHPAWSKQSDKPKEFVKKLLVLRETDRMTAKQALAHPWFTNPYLAQEFEALYARSIRDWQPRRKVAKLVEPIAAPSSNAGIASQTHSHYFQQPSVQASFRQVEERFTGSQDWDLSVVYPPSEGESIVAEHEEAQYEGPSRYDQYSFELGTRSGYEPSSEPFDNSMNQLSLDHNPPASGMYSTEVSASNGYKQQNDASEEPEENPMDPPVTFETAMHNHDSPVDSPVPYPPLTQKSPDNDAQKQTLFPDSSSSIVYETPIRDSQLQALACYNDIFSNADVSNHQDKVANAHKRRKLTQACP